MVGAMSTNEQKAVEAKHKAVCIFGIPLHSEIARMWETETAEFAGASQ